MAGGSRICSANFEEPHEGVVSCLSSVSSSRQTHNTYVSTPTIMSVYPRVLQLRRVFIQTVNFAEYIFER